MNNRAETIAENKELKQPSMTKTPVHFIDERGYLLKIVRAGDIVSFGETYVIGDWKAGVIRGFHKHAYTDEWFCVLNGTAKFVLYDDRPESTQYGQLQSFVLSGRRPEVLFVPAGVFHGHMALEDLTQTLAVASHPYNSQQPDETRVPYDSFGVQWQVTSK